MKTLVGQCVSAALAAVLFFSPCVVGLQAQAQRAGEVAAQIAGGHIERASGTLAAEVGMEVLWQDLVRTEPDGRVCVVLEGGSILNLGPNSQLRMTEHDTSTQQTTLTLISGQMRVRVAEPTAPDARFEIRTHSAAVFGVGTDFWVQVEPAHTVVIAYEGEVRVSHINPELGGQVRLLPGLQTVVSLERPPQAPGPPVPAEFQASVEETRVGPDLPQPAGPPVRVAGRKKWPWILAIAGGVGVAAELAMGGGYKQPKTTSTALGGTGRGGY